MWFKCFPKCLKKIAFEMMMSSSSVFSMNAKNAKYGTAFLIYRIMAF